MKVLVVDDDEVMRQLLREVLLKEGYGVHLAGSGEEAVRIIRSKQEIFPIIISDIRMLELDGLAVLREVKKSSKSSAVILMTGFGSMEGTILAIQEGAFDYVSKPFKMDEIKAVVSRAAKHWDTLKEKGKITKTTQGVAARVMTGKSAKIVEVYKTLARAALSSSNVLVDGESGTGKELVARSIHDNSDRRSKPFISVTSASLTEEQLEPELFEKAKGGSLYWDEIGDLTQGLQAKVLRLIEEDAFKTMNVRLISGTRLDLETLVKGGKFREDLYYRLKVISIELPPLRERMDDLSDLVDLFLARFAEHNKKSVSHVSNEAMELLRAYSWPGNVRELEYAIERAVAMSNSAVLFPEDFPDLRASAVGSEALVDTGSPATSLEEMERAHIIKVLTEVNFNKSKASEILGIDRATLYRKAQRYGIDLRGK